MDLLISWAAAAVTYVITALVCAVIGVGFAAGALLTDGGLLAWAGATGFAAYGLAALAASLVHREDRRDGKNERVRHAAAVLAVPVLVALISLVAAVLRGTSPALLAAELVAGLGAAALVWRGMVRLRSRGERRSAKATDAALRY